MKRVLLRHFGLTVALVLCVPLLSFAQHYVQTNLVTDGNTPGVTAAHTDGQLLNPWGLTRSTTSPWWVSDNVAGVSTLYDGTGAKLSRVVTIPPPKNPPPPPFLPAPTGVVFNGSSDFAVTPGHPAIFIFCTEDGTISAWPGGTSVATLEVDNSKVPNADNGAVYKGCTTGDINGTRYLYVANFRSGQIEVYDTNFAQVHLSLHHDDDERGGQFGGVGNGDGNGPFQDERIPRGFAPHNVQNVGGSLIVAYARQDAARHDAVKDGGGFVDIFSPSGRLEARLDSGPWLQAPWGIVWTPRDFGEFSNRLLIGNFGSGTIAAYNGFNGHFIGFMLDPTGKVIVNDGLWSLTFGNGASAGPYNSLFFTAGINDEMGGLFGTLTAVPNEQDGDEE